MIRRVLPFFFLLSFGLISCKKESKIPEGIETGILVDSIGIDLWGLNDSGDTLKLSSKENDYNVIFFYGSECGHCSQAIPEIKELLEDMNEEGIKTGLFAMDLNTRQEAFTVFLENEKPGPDFFFNGNECRSFAESWKVNSTPAFFLVDKNRKVVCPWTNAVYKLEDCIEDVLDY